MQWSRTLNYQSTLTRITFGAGAVQQVGQEARELGLSKVFISTDKGVEKAGVVEKLTESLKGSGLKYHVYNEVVPNPRIETVENGARQYREEGCDGLAAIGGGSSIDTAKAIGVLITNGGSIPDYHRGKAKILKPIPPLVAIPTTYGTGSEVTPMAVVTDTKSKLKKGIGRSRLMTATLAVLDPLLSTSLPTLAGASSGADALTHAIECYVSTNSNPIAETLALHAVNLISENLRSAVLSNDNVESTGNMLIASCMAGLAFPSTALGNGHAMSMPLGSLLDIPHGIANAILLPFVMEYNLPVAFQKFARIAEVMGIETSRLKPFEAGSLAVEGVKRLLADVGLPKTLSDVGCEEKHLPPLAEEAIVSWNIQANPRRTSKDDIIRLYKTAL